MLQSLRTYETVCGHVSLGTHSGALRRGGEAEGNVNGPPGPLSLAVRRGKRFSLICRDATLSKTVADEELPLKGMPNLQTPPFHLGVAQRECLAVPRVQDSGHVQSMRAHTPLILDPHTGAVQG
jgi:hypothetical protein|uniref:Uncharacterized protein n=1 Tax=Eutreptiella gymnastica TaxID=73025 RepID=A0A7S4CS34_9EUGL